tara:strand:+ start:486 stop:818 length:333 start_codon:yes stop_codon:yes gene_type:complete
MKEQIIKIIESKAQGKYHLEIEESDLEVIANEILNLFHVMKRLNDACFYGEVEMYQGRFLWEYESPEIESVEDDLWDANCIDADAIRKEGFETTGSWANKNKAGFEIIVS